MTRLVDIALRTRVDMTATYTIVVASELTVRYTSM
jgi:hypothetical protein